MRVRFYFIKEGVCFQLVICYLFFLVCLIWLSDVLNNCCCLLFFVDGDWVIVVCWYGYDDFQVLYNVSDGSVYLKNSFFYFGNQQMVLIYKIVYGFVFIVMFFMFIIKLYDFMFNLGSWLFYCEMFIRLIGILFLINLLLIVMEFVCMIVYFLLCWVVGRVKVYQVILCYVRCQGVRMMLWELK